MPEWSVWVLDIIAGDVASQALQTPIDRSVLDREAAALRRRQQRRQDCEN